jgi:exodeoxyribonuclease V beta subunit
VLKAVRPLINKTHTRLSFMGEDLSPASDLRQLVQPFVENCNRLEQLESDARVCWLAAHSELESLLDNIRPALNNGSYKEATADNTFSDLKNLLLAWANGGARPKRFERFADGSWKLKKVGKTVPDAPQHPAFTRIAELLKEETQQRETTAPGVKAFVLAHARQWLEQALQQRLQDKAELGFDDLLLQLDRALQGPQGEHLAKQIRADFPVAMIDEFQDTDPLQYRIFDRIYQLANSRGDASNCDSAIILIGDPKQAIYSFRNADIHTYLQARRATEGRHYNLAVNYRSSSAVVEAVNYVFAQAERFPAGAFRFKTTGSDPLPYLQVAARGRDEQLMIHGSAAHALNIWLASDTDSETSALPSRDYKQQMHVERARQRFSQRHRVNSTAPKRYCHPGA